jgi:hypothetical protein
MKRLLLALILFAFPALAADLVLLDERKSDYQIVVPDKQPTEALTACIQQTARLMQTAFKANGAELTVVTESERDAAKPAILLGNTLAAQKLGIDVTKLKGWSYIFQASGRDLIIAGREQTGAGDGTKQAPWDRIGTAKGVVDFLREYMGTRFLYPEIGPRQPISAAAKIDLLNSPAIEFLPTPTVAIPADLKLQKTPVLESFTAYPVFGSFYHIAQNRFPRVDDAFGGHTYERAVPVAKYWDTHPEYYALIGGQRQKGAGAQAQFCISNPDVQELLYKDLIDLIDQGFHTVDLGQPDGFRPCQCENCAKLFGTGGDWSEKLWILHRNLAERVLAARPGHVVTMTSYILTELPPKSFSKFPANTQILLTGTNEEDIAPWRKCEVPQGFTGYIYNWCPNLSTRYTPMRTPGFIEQQAKRLVANRIQSIYQDGPGSIQGLEGPVYYTMGRMFDDAEKNQAKLLVHEFCGAAFDKAGPPMIQFYDQLYHAIELYSRYLGTRDPAWVYQDIYGRRRKHLSDPMQFLGFFYTPELLASLETQLSQAEKLGKTEKVKLRLALVRREFDYLHGLARVVHLYHAYKMVPDRMLRDRLLDAIDARNAEIASYFDEKGRTKAVAGWPYTYFPPIGHDAKHLRLTYNGYQEPFENTPFNWDTKAIRNAPLEGGKQLAARVVQGAITPDSPQWQQAAAAELVALPGNPITQKTTLRAAYDDTNVYLLIESELPAAFMKPKVAGEESVAIYLAPNASGEVAYRFTVGLQSGEKADAARGLVTNAMDPRHGQFDPDWSGAWTYESRLEPEKNRWLAFVKIPFKTIGVEAPKGGTFWRANFGRVHEAAVNQIERSLWSVQPGSKGMEDRNDLGELVFSAAEQAAVTPVKPGLRALREELYRTSFEIPADWKNLADPLPTRLDQWLFHIDPLEQGTKAGWQQPGLDESEWVKMSVPSFWAENQAVGKFEGDGWYRTTITVPAEWKGKTLRLLFGSIDEQAWIYVNGNLVKEHTEASEKKSYNELWEEPFTAEIPPAQLKYGQPNVLAVRVHNSTANGGIWRPVLAHGVPAK